MADAPPRNPVHDAKMLADLRDYVAARRTMNRGRDWLITDKELDLLLAIADVIDIPLTDEPLPADSWHDGSRPGPDPSTFIVCENAACSVSTFRMQMQGRCPSCNRLGFVIA